MTDATGNSPFNEKISYANRQLAKQRLEAAFATKVAGRDEEAKRYLSDAVRTNPELCTDSGAVGLASSLFGLPRDRAIAYLNEVSQQPIEKSAYQPKFEITVEVLTTWVEALLLLAILVIFMGFVYVGIIRAAVGVTDMLRSLSRETPPPELSQALSELNTLTTVNIVREALLRGFQLWMATLISGIVTFAIGTFQGGTGGIGKVVRYTNRVSLIIYLFITVGVAMILYAVNLYTTNRNAAGVLVGFSLFMIGITSIVGLFGYTYATAKAHQVGFFRASSITLLANFAAGIVVSVLGVFNG
jgi:hypothetical protein